MDPELEVIKKVLDEAYTLLSDFECCFEGSENSSVFLENALTDILYISKRLHTRIYD